jgi:hypothetical protein
MDWLRRGWVYDSDKKINRVVVDVAPLSTSRSTTVTTSHIANRCQVQRMASANVIVVMGHVGRLFTLVRVSNGRGLWLWPIWPVSGQESRYPLHGSILLLETSIPCGQLAEEWGMTQW